MDDSNLIRFKVGTLKVFAVSNMETFNNANLMGDSLRDRIRIQSELKVSSEILQTL